MRDVILASFCGAMAVIGLGAYADPEVGPEQWKAVFPVGREIVTQNTYALQGDFIPETDSETNWMSRWFSRTGLDLLGASGTLCFSGSNTVRSTSLFVDEADVASALYWKYEYLLADQLAIRMSVNLQEGALLDACGLFYAIDPFLADALREYKERYGTTATTVDNIIKLLKISLSKSRVKKLISRIPPGIATNFYCKISQVLPWGTLHKKSEERIRELRDKNSKWYKSHGIEVLDDVDGNSFPLDLTDSAVCDALARTLNVDVDAFKDLLAGHKAIRSFNEELAGRTLLVKTDPHGLNEESISRFAEMDAMVYEEDEKCLDEREKAREDMGYTCEQIKAWRDGIQMRRSHAQKNTDLIVRVLKEKGKLSLVDFCRMIGLRGDFWAIREHFPGQSGASFWDTHSQLDPYLPVWGTKNANTRIATLRDRRVGATWELDGRMLNCFLGDEFANYSITGKVWVTRLKDMNVDDESASNNIACLETMVQTSSFLSPEESPRRRVHVLKLSKSYRGRAADLRMTPTDPYNPNLFDFVFEGGDSYILVDAETGIPCYFNIDLKADVIGRGRVLDIKRCEGLTLAPGTNVRLILRSVVLAVTDEPLVSKWLISE